MEWMLAPLKRYAQFGGRSRPQEFWMFFLLQLTIYGLLYILSLVVTLGLVASSSAMSNAGDTAAGMMGMIAAQGIFGIIELLIVLGLFVPNLAVATRRLHDTNRSGWWQMLFWAPWLLGVVALGVGLANTSSGNGSSFLAAFFVMAVVQLIGLLVLIVFYVMPGTPGPNQYGPDPLGRAPGMAAYPPPGYPPQNYQQPPRAY